MNGDNDMVYHLGLLVATLRGFLFVCLRQQMPRMTATMTRATAAGNTTYSQRLKSEHWGRPHTLTKYFKIWNLRIVFH